MLILDVCSSKINEENRHLKFLLVITSVTFRKHPILIKKIYGVNIFYNLIVTYYLTLGTCDTNRL